MTTTPSKLRADVVLAYLQSAGESTADEIGNAASMKKREVEHAIYLLANQAKIQPEYRSGVGFVYRATVEPEGWDDE